ncbi:MAG: DUF2690 domain-containing protein [Catenulispora sp.]|nr:DUF2690 domain-containing protein [Catenulispora sp.]
MPGGAASVGTDGAAEPDPADRADAAHRPKRRLQLGAGAVAAVLAVAAVAYLAGGGRDKTAAPAHPGAPTTASAASPGCKRSGCLGKDPGATGCANDGKTLITANDGKVTLYIRYSPRCEAAWAKLTEGAPNDTATITTNSGQSQTALIHWGYDAYSPMVDAGNDVTLKVCGHQPEGDNCTPDVADPPQYLTAHPQH